jgi:hypothetical protein
MGFLYCFNNLLIPAAPAQITGQRNSNFFFRWIGMMIQQIFCTHQHSWSAKSTMHSIMGKEGFLQRMQSIGFCKSFDSEYFLPVNLRSKYQARIDGSPVQVDCACTALAYLTAAFGTGQTKLIAKKRQERHIRIDIELVLSAINYSFYGDGL